MSGIRVRFLLKPRRWADVPLPPFPANEVGMAAAPPAGPAADALKELIQSTQNRRAAKSQRFATGRQHWLTRR